MAIAYWIIAGLLAVLYLFVGAKKILQSRSELVDSGMEWAGSRSSAQVKTIGVLELLGSAGLILPPLLRVLAPLAIPRPPGCPCFKSARSSSTFDGANTCP